MANSLQLCLDYADECDDTLVNAELCDPDFNWNFVKKIADLTSLSNINFYKSEMKFEDRLNDLQKCLQEKKSSTLSETFKGFVIQRSFILPNWMLD